MQRDPEEVLREIEQSAFRAQGPAGRRIDRLLPEATNADSGAAMLIGAALAVLVVAGLAA